MFCVGDSVVYGTSGICRIEEICRSPFDPTDDRMYYILKPVFEIGSSRIYAPVENGTKVIRPPMTAQEAKTLIDSIPNISVLEVLNERTRRETYRQAMATADPAAYVQVLKTVSQRRGDATARGKRLSEADVEFDRMARNFLQGELSLALDMSAQEVEDLFADCAACS